MKKSIIAMSMILAFAGVSFAADAPKTVAKPAEASPSAVKENAPVALTVPAAKHKKQVKKTTEVNSQDEKSVTK